MEKDLIDWIQRISKPMDELGGFSVCPFAKKALEEKKIFFKQGNFLKRNFFNHTWQNFY